jgi:hypothetical protein
LDYQQLMTEAPDFIIGTNVAPPETGLLIGEQTCADLRPSIMPKTSKHPRTSLQPMLIRDIRSQILGAATYLLASSTGNQSLIRFSAATNPVQS